MFHDNSQARSCQRGGDWSSGASFNSLPLE
jgi:hypothetical protein